LEDEFQFLEDRAESVAILHADPRGAKLWWKTFYGPSN
jgi:hypothetical protein